MRVHGCASHCVATPGFLTECAGEATGGSGFVISSDGLVVTNHHVFAIQRSVPGNTEFRAQFDDGRVYTLQPLASDEEADIAVGRLVLPPGTRMRALRPGSTRGMKRGEPVAVLGAPLSGALVPSVGCLAGIRYVADDEAMNTVLNSRSDWCLLQI
ncbi:serine protease, partial [archaeon]